jgi:hypothetical protein
MNKRIKYIVIVGSGALALMVIREFGLISINWKKTSTEGSNTISRSYSNGNKPILQLVDLDIPVELLDYIPFVKSKTVVGEGEVADGNGGKIKYEYNYTVRVVGICSAHELRKSLKQHILKSLND